MSEILLVNRPVVARPPRPAPVAAMAGTLAMLGLGVFFWLSEARASQEQGDLLPPLTTTTAPAPAPLAAEAAPPGVPPSPAPFFIPNSGPVTLVPTNPGIGRPSIVMNPNPSTSAADRLRERLRAPALIVDLAQTDPQRQGGAVRSDSGGVAQSGPGSAPGAGPSPSGATGIGIGAGAGPAPAVDRNLSDTERFSERVGNQEVDVARAQRMTGLDRLVPQGAIIGAVMETALNSDLPGFARAITQRDVYSFDGSAVLIPAGSRVIGQYKSGVAQGASRVFILWTRLIRPDGVSIDLASPAVDELGRGGLGGKVNRHFLQRFGGAILSSVLSGGISAAAASLSGGSTIIVGSAGQAASLAGQATQSGEIPPTITTRQGAPVRIFVARDLDFTRVGPAQ